MWVNPATALRCKGKCGYRSGTKAEKKAKSASEQSGEWIVAYECPDCGFWHIGHAEHAQFVIAPVKLCKGCREPVPDEQEGKFCTAQCQLNYVARKAHQNMLLKQAMGG